MINETNHGWKSRYDYKNMSNTEKLTGRILHVQDNCWNMAKVGFVIFGCLVVYFILNGDVDFSGVIKIHNLLK